MDISDFYQTFFDEADELLADMEQHLLDGDLVFAVPTEFGPMRRNPVCELRFAALPQQHDGCRCGNRFRE